MQSHFCKEIKSRLQSVTFYFHTTVFPGVQFVPILPIKLVYHSQVLQAVSKCLHSICLLHNKIAALQDAYSTNFSLTISLCPMCLQGRLSTSKIGGMTKVDQCYPKGGSIKHCAWVQKVVGWSIPFWERISFEKAPLTSPRKRSTLQAVFSLAEIILLYTLLYSRCTMSHESLLWFKLQAENRSKS